MPPTDAVLWILAVVAGISGAGAGPGIILGDAVKAALAVVMIGLFVVVYFYRPLRWLRPPPANPFTPAASYISAPTHPAGWLISPF